MPLSLFRRKVGKLGVTIEIKLIDVMTAFFDEKILRGELALWGSPLRFSSLKRLENVFVRGVRIILFIMEKSFKLNAAKKFFFVKFFGYRNKIQSLTEDGFLCVGKRKIFWNSNYGVEVFK